MPKHREPERGKDSRASSATLPAVARGKEKRLAHRAGEARLPAGAVSSAQPLDGEVEQDVELLAAERRRPRPFPAPRRRSRHRCRRRSCPCLPCCPRHRGGRGQPRPSTYPTEIAAHAARQRGQPSGLEGALGSQPPDRRRGARHRRPVTLTRCGCRRRRPGRRSRWRWCSRRAGSRGRWQARRRAADEPADLVGAPAEAALDALAVVAGVGGAGQHAEYSAVTQPRPLPLRQRGTPSVTLAAQSTRVLPNSTRQLPSAGSCQPRVSLTGRSSS